MCGRFPAGGVRRQSTGNSSDPTLPERIHCPLSVRSRRCGRCRRCIRRRRCPCAGSDGHLVGRDQRLRGDAAHGATLRGLLRRGGSRLCTAAIASGETGVVPDRARARCLDGRLSSAWRAPSTLRGAAVQWGVPHDVRAGPGLDGRTRTCPGASRRVFTGIAALALVLLVSGTVRVPESPVVSYRLVEGVAVGAGRGIGSPSPI